MSKIGKPYERPLSPELAEEILNIPFQQPDREIPQTIGEHVKRAAQAVEGANKMLASSQVAKIVARVLMRDLKKRGDPSLYVAPDGTVMLRVSYVEGMKTSQEVPVVRGLGTSDLPKLDSLRKKAGELGVDISHLGRQRRAIYELLKSASEKATHDGEDDESEDSH